jgi:hypothetical protein
MVSQGLRICIWQLNDLPGLHGLSFVAEKEPTVKATVADSFSSGWFNYM